MRAVACVKDRVIFENHDGRFDGVESVAAVEENVVARVEGAKAARFASIDGVVGNVPGAAVDYQGRSHAGKEDSRCSKSGRRLVERISGIGYQMSEIGYQLSANRNKSDQRTAIGDQETEGETRHCS
jgi:hypothetical protein